MLMLSSVSAFARSLVVYLVSLLVVPISAQCRTNTSSYLQFPRFTAVPSQLSSEHGLANSHTQIPSLLLAASLLVWGLLALGRWVGSSTGSWCRCLVLPRGSGVLGECRFVSREPSVTCGWWWRRTGTISQTGKPVLEVGTIFGFAPTIIWPPRGAGRLKRAITSWTKTTYIRVIGTLKIMYSTQPNARFDVICRSTIAVFPDTYTYTDASQKYVKSSDILAPFTNSHTAFSVEGER
ncbi:hypothetical protein DFH09DRAFT_1171951 [Mycena vulgaris]|nr:hypothetical protein DFH09DRAFT_1171951 [Mycena vulgaris]